MLVETIQNFLREAPKKGPDAIDCGMCKAIQAYLRNLHVYPLLVEFTDELLKHVDNFEGLYQTEGNLPKSGGDCRFCEVAQDLVTLTNSKSNELRASPLSAQQVIGWALYKALVIVHYRIVSYMPEVSSDNLPGFAAEIASVAQTISRLQHLIEFPRAESDRAESDRAESDGTESDHDFPLDVYSASRIGGHLLLGGNGFVDIVSPGGKRVRWYLSNNVNRLVACTITNKLSVFITDYAASVYLVGPIQSPRLISDNAIRQATGHDAPINSTLESGPYLYVVWAHGWITQHLIVDILNYRLEHLREFDMNPANDDSYAEVIHQYPATPVPLAPFQPGALYVQIRNAKNSERHLIAQLTETGQLTVVPLGYSSSIFAFGNDGSLATVDHFDRKLRIASAGKSLVVIDLAGPLSSGRVFPFPGITAMGPSGFLVNDPYFNMVLPIVNRAVVPFDDLLYPLISHAFALSESGLFFTTHSKQQIISVSVNPRIPYRVAGDVDAFLASLPLAIEVDSCSDRDNCRRYLGDTEVLTPILLYLS